MDKDALVAKLAESTVKFVQPSTPLVQGNERKRVLEKEGEDGQPSRGRARR
jgi:hypothetical protein